MHVVPTEGPEVDLCRPCQMMWFDADEMQQLPGRDELELKQERWKAELRRLQRRREEREQYRRRMMERVVQLMWLT